MSLAIVCRRIILYLKQKYIFKDYLKIDQQAIWILDTPIIN